MCRHLVPPSAAAAAAAAASVLSLQWIVDVALWALSRYERYAPGFIRRPLLAAGMAFALEYVQAEDLQTNYVDIGPVNKVRRRRAAAGSA